MELIDKDIRAGLKFITKNNQPFYRTAYYPPFFQTNEPLYLYYPHFKLQDARVLTVAGSGDQVLEAIHWGAKDIVSFDQNRFAYYVTSLKMAGVKGLDYPEFVDFFGCLDFKYAYDATVYEKKIAPYLDTLPRTFWDAIYKKVNNKHLPLKDSFLCAVPESSANFNYRSYLSSEGYNITKNNLAHVNFSFLAIKLFGVPLYLSKSEPFDTMFLSNIYDWLEEYQQGIFTAFIESILANYLKEDGKCASYCIFNDRQCVTDEPFRDNYLNQYFKDSQNSISVYTYVKK